VPLFYAEFSANEAAYFQLLQPALLIGPMTADATATAFEPSLVIDSGHAAALFGAGSILTDMISTYRRNDTFGTVWAIGVPDAGGATASEVTDTINGTATAAGNMTIYLNGDRISVPVASGDGGTVIAQRLADAINGNSFSLVQASVSANALILTSRAGGTIGDSLTRIWNWRGIAGGEFHPPGITVSEGTGFIGGAGAPDLAPVIAAMQADEYDFICFPWSDPATLNLFQEEMNDIAGRWAWDRQEYGHCFTARAGTYGDLVTFGRTRNDPHTSILGYDNSPTPPWRFAAAFAAQAAVSLRNDPARPLQTLPLIGCLPPLRGHGFSIGQAQTLLFSGIATSRDVLGQVQIQRAITTYQRNAWNQPDPSWLDVQTPFTLAYLVRFMRQRILQKFPRHKLADDGTPLGFGQAVVTPRIVKAELVAAYSELISVGLMENMEAFKTFLIVERDQNDPNRINVLLPPDLVNQLRIVAMQVAFRLQYAPGALVSPTAVAAATNAAIAAGAVPYSPVPRPGIVPQVAPITPFI